MSARTLLEKVDENLYVLRADDLDVRYFEAVWEIPEKITYNAYLLLEGDYRILFDGWKLPYSDQFLELIRSLVDPRDLTHLVVHHAEPDHSGSLPRVLEANGFRAAVLTHPMAATMLKRIYGIEAKFRPVKDGEEIEIGDGVLKFVYTPWLHWPETMMSLLADRLILFSGDAFGGYSIPSSIFDDSEEVVAEFLPHARKYVATIIGAYRDHIIRGVEKLRRLGKPPRIIAPAHGLVWRRRPELIVDYYVRLAKGVPEGDKLLVVSGSMYGSTEKAVKVAVEEAARLGCAIALHRFDQSESASISEIIGDAIDSRAIVLAAPTYEAGLYPPIEYVVRLIARKIPPKPALIISSYGWGSAAARIISEILSSADFKIVDAIDFRGAAGEEDLEKIREGVRRLVEFQF